MNTTEISQLELHNIFIPSKVKSKKLMIILHGRGDSGEGFTSLPSFFNIDEMNYLLLDAPFEYATGFSWYQLPPNQLPGIEYSSQMLTKILDNLFEEQFNASESFLFGFSQGSLLVFEFGARYEKVLAGYIAISGYIYDAKKLLTQLNPQLQENKFLCTHGSYDNVLPLATSQEQVEYLQDNGFAIDFKLYDKEHNIDKDELEMITTWIKERL